MISIDDFKKVEIRAGKILSAEPVAGSEKLLKLSVDFGEIVPRQVLSGIAKFVTREELLGNTYPFVTNLEPREMMGLKSEAMILAFSNEPTESNPTGVFSLLKINDKITPGTLAK